MCAGHHSREERIEAAHFLHKKLEIMARSELLAVCGVRVQRVGCKNHIHYVCHSWTQYVQYLNRSDARLEKRSVKLPVQRVT